MEALTKHRASTCTCRKSPHVDSGRMRKKNSMQGNPDVQLTIVVSSYMCPLSHACQLYAQVAHSVF